MLSTQRRRNQGRVGAYVKERERILVHTREVHPKCMCKKNLTSHRFAAISSHMIQTTLIWGLYSGFWCQTNP